MECSSVTAVFSYCFYRFKTLLNSITNPRLSIMVLPGLE